MSRNHYIFGEIGNNQFSRIGFPFSSAEKAFEKIKELKKRRKHKSYRIYKLDKNKQSPLLVNIEKRHYTIKQP